MTCIFIIISYRSYLNKTLHRRKKNISKSINQASWFFLFSGRKSLIIKPLEQVVNYYILLLKLRKHYFEALLWILLWNGPHSLEKSSSILKILMSHDCYIYVQQSFRRSSTCWTAFLTMTYVYVLHHVIYIYIYIYKQRYNNYKVPNSTFF